MAIHNNDNLLVSVFFKKSRPRWMIKKSLLEMLKADAKALNVSLNVLLECIIIKELSNG